MRRIYDQLRLGDWLDRNRVRAYLRIVFFCQAVAFVFIVLNTHHLTGLRQEPGSTDFVSFYAAGRLAQQGTPELAYSPEAHKQMEATLTEKGSPYFAFYYPPIYLLICRLLATVPYLVAFVGFVSLTGLFFLASMRPVLPRDVFPLAILAAPPFLLALGSGQNSFLTAGCFGFGLLLLRRRPLLAGMFFGVVCYKPHFGIILPVALLFGREWRAILGAAISVASLAGASVLAFGWESWQRFAAIQGLSFATFANGWVDHAQQATVFASLRLLGLSIDAAYGIHAMIACAVLALTAHVWWRSRDLSARAMTLTIGATLIPPVFLNYDLLMAGIGMAWLANRAETTGYRPWEKTALFLAFVVLDFSQFSGKYIHVTLSPWVMLALFVLVYRRCRSVWSKGAERSLAFLQPA